MVKRSFDQNAFDTDVLERNIPVAVLSAISVFAVIYSSLLICNFTAFDEVAIKSNKYNPNFREERSFPTSLSGDFFVGLDRLFTDFLNREVVFDWSEDKENNAPSVFVASPVLLLSLIGFYYLLRSSRDDSLPDADFDGGRHSHFHKTVLARHVTTVLPFLFLPLIFCGR